MTERVTGVVREQPEDFVVEEVSDFSPTGEGDHLALWVEKRGLDHRSMVRRIAQHFGIRPTDVGWAGMKDRGAVTRQWLTAKVPRDDAPPLQANDLSIEDIRRTSRKIRPGHLRGNRFEIRIRQVDPTRAHEVTSRLGTVVSSGLPNRFMEQRFGHRGVNPVLGALLLGQHWQDLLDHWLGPIGPSYSRSERPRREAYAAGQFREAQDQWPHNWAPERAALEHLAIGATAQETVQEVPKSIRRIWTDSVQARVFNTVVDARIAQDTLSTCLEGDIVWHHDRFLEAVGSPRSLQVPTGPLWGRTMTRAEGEVDVLERDAIAACGLDLDSLTTGPAAPGGGRRPLTAPLVDVGNEIGRDQHGPFVAVRFTLPRGTYATAVLDEIIDRVLPGKKPGAHPRTPS